MALDSTHIESLRRPESNVYLCCHAKRAALSHTTSTSFNGTKIYYEERKTCSRRLDDNVKIYSCQQCHTYREISSSSHSGDNTKNPILVWKRSSGSSESIGREKSVGMVTGNFYFWASKLPIVLFTTRLCTSAHTGSCLEIIEFFCETKKRKKL